MEDLYALKRYEKLVDRANKSGLILSVVVSAPNFFIGIFQGDRRLGTCESLDECCYFLDGFNKGVEHERNRSKTAKTGSFPVGA